MRNISTFSIRTILLFSVLFLSLLHGVSPAQSLADQENAISIQQVSEPSAKVINENPGFPGINQDISVTADVIAPAGVDPNQVRLFYDYRSTAGEGDVSMVGSTTSLTPNQFNSITTLEANQKQVNFTYISDYIDNVAITINAGGPGSPDFISFSYSFYDLDTSAWVEIDSQTGISQPSLTFSRAGVMGGFAFTAVVQRGQDGGSNVPNDPTFDGASVIEATRQFTATITAPGTSTAIDYFIRAVDLDGITFFSNNYTIYANTKPTLTSYNNLADKINGSDTEYVLNATVRDLDGYETLEKVTAYYKTISQVYWLQAELVFDRNVNATDAIFVGLIDIANLTGFEENLEIYLNMTDVVDGALQPATQSNPISVFLDSRGPILQNSISIFADPLINNATKINSTITLNMTFVDVSGVMDANLVFTLNNGTQMVEDLINSSLLQESDTLEEFSYVFPGYLENTEIVYHFVTTDFVGNVYTSNYFQVFVDAEGPVIIEQSSAPRYPSYTTGATIVYNIWDAAGLNTQEFYYQYENDNTWSTAFASEINYDDEINQEEIFELVPQGSATNIGNIRDDNISRFTLEVSPTISIDEAIVDIDFTHQRASDLRIYLGYLNNTYLVFDRLAYQSITFSLRDYINLNALDTGNITIEVHDLVEDFGGVMNSISIQLIDYFVPVDFTYKATIPPIDLDTTVYYYFVFEDNLGNVRNSTVFSVYFDGKAPVISEFTVYAGTVDAEGAKSLPVEAIIVDKGTLDSVELYFKYRVEDAWNINSMSVLNGSQTDYYGNLPMVNANGTLFYQIRVFDKAGFSTNTSVYNFKYIDANAPEIRLITDISEVFDLTDTNAIRLEVEVSADSNISSVQLVYSINGGDEIIVNMGRTPQGTYIFDIVVDTEEGDIEFFFIAIDDDSQQTTTENYILSFVNADVDSLEDLLPYALAVGAAAVVGSIGYSVFKKMKGNPSGILAKRPADLDYSSNDWDDEDW